LQLTPLNARLTAARLINSGHQQRWLNSVSDSNAQAALPGDELTGSLTLFPPTPGDKLASSLPTPDFHRKRLIFNRLQLPGQVHVYSTECSAGERLRARLLIPVLPTGGSVAPGFALVAQSLPYSADVQRLPIDLPAGFSAVVAPPPTELIAPVKDLFTGVSYYPGPSIDTRTLVSGRCYLVVWSPHNHMGKYVLQVGHRQPWRWSYWMQAPRYWWQIRGWFGQSRAAAYAIGAGALATGFVAWRLARRRSRRS